MLLLLAFLLLANAVFGSMPGIRQAEREAFPNNLVGLNLVEFYSPNCHHCVRYKRTVRRLVKFIDSNATELHGMTLQQFSCKGGDHCHRLNLNALPTLRLYLNDTLLGTIEGVARIGYITGWISEVLKTNAELIAQHEARIRTSEGGNEAQLMAAPIVLPGRPSPLMATVIATLVTTVQRTLALTTTIMRRTSTPTMTPTPRTPETTATQTTAPLGTPTPRPVALAAGGPPLVPKPAKIPAMVDGPAH